MEFLTAVGEMCDFSRVFLGRFAHTKTLQKKLGTWSANVQALLTTIQKSNER